MAFIEHRPSSASSTSNNPPFYSSDEQSSGAELRSERSFSLPPPDCPKPPRRRTLEYPSATSSRKPSSEDSGSQSQSQFNDWWLYYDPSYSHLSSLEATNGSQTPPQQAFWNPHTDHPLSLSEQADVLNRMQQDLLGVNLESIKGPLRQLASLGDNAPAMQQQQPTPAVQPPPSQQVNTTTTTTTTTPGKNRERTEGDATNRDMKTVSPQEAFLDYDDTVKKAPVGTLFGSIPSPPHLASGTPTKSSHVRSSAMSNGPSTGSGSASGKKSGIGRGGQFSVPENAVSWRANSNGANSASSSAAEDDEAATPSSSAGAAGGPKRPGLGPSRSSSSLATSTNNNADWEDWTTRPLPPAEAPLPGFAPPPPARSMQLQYPTLAAPVISTFDEPPEPGFAQPPPPPGAAASTSSPASSTKGSKSKGSNVKKASTLTADFGPATRSPPPPRRARAAARKFTEYELGDESSGVSSDEYAPADGERLDASGQPVPGGSKGGHHHKRSLDEFRAGEDDDEFDFDDEDDEDEFGGGGGGSRRRAGGAGGSSRKRHHGAHPSHSAGDIVCSFVVDGRPCGTVFRRPYDLNRHMQTIHGVGAGPKKEWRCRVCDTVFSRKDALIRHARTSKHKNPLG